jgi:uncharacterized membrane protein
MRKWFPILPVLTAFLVSAWLYPQLPARVATHWDLHGQPNGYSSRLVAALLVPGMAVALWGLLRFIPRIDPHRENYARFQGTYDLVIAAIVTFLCAIHVMVLGTAVGWPMPDLARTVPVGVGTLTIIVGNVIPRARPNWWFGIRTPWTLSSDTVWARTHRVGGYLLTAAGVIALLSAFLPPAVGTVVLLVAVGGASLGSVVYSYFTWRGEQP